MKHLSILAAFAAALLAAAPAHALTWNWSDSNGNLTGTFETDGDALNGAAGTYVFTGFNVLTSTYFDVSQISSAWDHASGGSMGFVWNGSAATQFWRFGGSFTNGSNFYNYDSQGAYNRIWIAFSPSSMLVGDTDYSPRYDIAGGPVMSVAPSAAVPVPAAAGLLAAAVGALGFLRRRA